jgi:pyruvate ferredoxin oxidoreductase gamma subunit
MPRPPPAARVRIVFEIRIHGRGGQGVVTAAELLAIAAFDEGRHSQAFPSFGSERTGAPVVAFARIDDRVIRSREPIVAPDALIVQDPTLLHQVAVFDGVKPGAYVLINTARDAEELGLDELDARLLTVPATELARERLGRPLPNAALLGAFAAFTGVVSLNAVRAAIAEKFPPDLAERNAAAATAAHDHVLAHV